ncbi:hypothetical protein MMPV_006692 [Pyropia vietnamensis]
MAFVGGTPLCAHLGAAAAPRATGRLVTRRPALPACRVSAASAATTTPRMSSSENTSAPSAASLTALRSARSSGEMSAPVTDADMGNRSFQLIEMEDAEQAVSALYLRAADKGVDFGATDGPVPDSVTGEWTLNEEDGTFGLSLTRKYDGGFGFSVSRFYKGHYERREGSSLVTVQGYIFQTEHAMDPENAVGFFSMVMATDDLPSEDYDVTKTNAD